MENDMVETSKVTSYRGKYLRVNLPSEVVEWLGLKAGDIIVWRPIEREGKRAMLIEKLE